MITIDTKLNGVKLYQPDVFKDFRGEYIETFNTEKYTEIPPFVQDDIAISRLGVLRGFHGDLVTWKLTQVVHGVIYSVILDCRKESPTLGGWQIFILSGENHHQLLLPPGIGNSTLALTDNVVYSYKQTTHYVNKQFTVKWDDPALGVPWPVQKPILSERDRLAKSLDEVMLTLR